MAERVLLIIPAKNEHEHIGRILQSALAAKRAGLVHDAVVVDDHSSQESHERMREQVERAGVKFLVNAGRQGKAFAVLHGAKHLVNDWSDLIVTMDAEVPFTPRQVSQLIEPLRKDNSPKMTVGTVKDDDPKISGQRAFRAELIRPWFSPTKTWRHLLGLDAYSLEVALNYLVTGEALHFYDDSLRSKIDPAKPETMKHKGILFVDTQFHPARCFSYPAVQGAKRTAAQIGLRKDRARDLRKFRRTRHGKP